MPLKRKKFAPTHHSGLVCSLNWGRHLSFLRACDNISRSIFRVYPCSRSCVSVWFRHMSVHMSAEHASDILSGLVLRWANQRLSTAATVATPEATPVAATVPTSLITSIFFALAFLALAPLGSNAWARGPDLPSVEFAVQLLALPVEARTTHQLILSGGPFPYDKDGTTFFNRERLLPPKPRGHYKEYTVRTPRARNRGARRIVCGGKPPTRPEVCFYTEDHYNSFRRITP